MSQTITYKTKYKSLNSIKKVIDNLAGSGAFGKNTVVTAKGEPGFSPGLFRPRDPKEEVVFVVRNNDRDFFKEGFYEPGFAIAINRETKEITIVYDYRSGSDEKITAATRKKMEQMIEAGDTLNKVKDNMVPHLTNVKIEKKSATEWVVEGELTPEQLKDFLVKGRL